MKKIILFLITIALIFNVKAVTDNEYNNTIVKLNEAYDKFIGACNNGERTAIIKYAHGDLEQLSGGFSTFKSLTTDGGNRINDICANYAENLYNTLNYAKRYVDNNDLYSVSLETMIEIKENVFVNGSRITSRKDLTIIDDCNLIDNDLKKILKEYLGYFQIGCTSITIILCMTDLYKLFVSKEMDNKKTFKKIKGRLIALAILLLAPVIINIIIDLINKYVDVEAVKCLES